MPTYEFECKCGKIYEEITHYDPKGKYKNVKCPLCGSKQKTKLMSVCNFQFSNPEGTDRYNNSHDYRFHHKQKDVRAERTAAQKASHMGENVYNPINDLENNVWGEAK